MHQFLAYRQATLWPAVRDHVFAQLFPASPVCPVSKGPALSEYVSNAESRLHMELNRLDTVFLDETDFLCGDRMTFADVSCACALSILDWVSGCGRAPPDTGRRRRAHAHLPRGSLAQALDEQLSRRRRVAPSRARAAALL